MDSPVPDQLLKAIIGMLQSGKESATELQNLFTLMASGDHDGSARAEELAERISISLNEIVSVLMGSSSSAEINEPCQIAAPDGNPKRVSPSGGRSSKGSDHHGRKRPGMKDRKDYYRRRNRSVSSVVVSAARGDGYAWRKYGQKEILNTNFPRCYFRCTRKHDQGCKATKQVQKIRDDPILYQITYFGHHTCQETLMRAPQIISDPEDPMESNLINFQTRAPQDHRQHVPDAISPAPNHQELRDEAQSDVTDSKSCLDSSMWQDMIASECSGDQKMEPSNANSSGGHNEEVVSSFHTSSSAPLNGLAMEGFGNKFTDIGDDLYLEDVELFRAFSN